VLFLEQPLEAPPGRVAGLLAAALGEIEVLDDSNSSDSGFSLMRDGCPAGIDGAELKSDPIASAMSDVLIL